MRLDPRWGGVVVTGLTLTHLMPVCLFSPLLLFLFQVPGKRRKDDTRIHYWSELCGALTRDLFVLLPPDLIHFFKLLVCVKDEAKYPPPPLQTAREIRLSFAWGSELKTWFSRCFSLLLLLFSPILGAMKEDDLWWARRCQELAESSPSRRSRPYCQVQRGLGILKRRHFQLQENKKPETNLPRVTGWFFKTDRLDSFVIPAWEASWNLTVTMPRRKQQEPRRSAGITLPYNF